jgi:hypothetical protein
MMAWRQTAAIGCVLFFFASLGGATSQDESVIRDIILARFAKVHNLIVHYTLTSHPTLPPGMRIEDAFVKTESGHRFIEVGIKVEKGEFSILGGSVFCSQTEQSFDSDIKDPAFYRIRRLDRKTEILTPGKGETLLGLTLDGQTDFQGQIREGEEVPSSCIPTVLGLGIRELPHLFTADDIKKMKIDRSTNGKIVLQRQEDTNIDEWTVDPNRGYAITHYHRRSSSGQGYVDWAMEDFRDVGGIVLPHKVRATLWWDDGSKGPDWIVDVSEYRLNDPANTPERYRMKWPEGTQVTDFRSGVTFVAHGENLVYDDDRIAKEVIESLNAIGPNDVNASNVHLTRPDFNQIGLRDQQRKVDTNEPRILATPADSVHSRLWLWAVGGAGILGLIFAVRHRARHSHRP